MPTAILISFQFEDVEWEIQQTVRNEALESLDAIADAWYEARRNHALNYLKLLTAGSTFPLHRRAEMLAIEMRSNFGGQATLVRATEYRSSHDLISDKQGALVVLPDMVIAGAEPDKLTGVDPVRGDEAHRWSDLMGGSNS